MERHVESGDVGGGEQKVDRRGEAEPTIPDEHARRRAEEKLGWEAEGRCGKVVGGELARL